MTVRLLGNSAITFQKRISAKNEQGDIIETPDQTLWRVAANIAAAEMSFGVCDPAEVTEDFYQIMADMDFLPNSPCLVNAGRPLGQLAACFVIPVEDSIEGIFGSVGLAALIHKTGGGTGFGFGRLRPSGMTVASTGREASGPVSFMKVFDAATESIKQGGVRRGANMGVLPISHPDVEEFITLKSDNKTLSNFNISLAVTDRFMECLREGIPFPLEFGGQVVKYIDPRELWDKIAQAAWTSGDPGVLFIDRINQYNPIPNLGTIEATNPCGEVPLLPYHTCNLGSVNLSNFVQGSDFDYARLEQVVHMAVRFLDNVIEVNHYPHPKIAEETKKARKIGLGVMGWADALIKMGIPYASQEARDLALKLMERFKSYADAASVQLAQERGSFPAFDGSVLSAEFPHGIRNSSRTVMAPTGTLSILADCSSGIEPLFGLAFSKNVMDTTLTHVARPAYEIIRDRVHPSQVELVCKMIREGVPAKIACPELADVLATAHEISPEDHVLMQAAFQKFTDDSISKTINFSNSATPADIQKAYELAFDTGCKGITIYRDGCKEFQVLVHPAATAFPVEDRGSADTCTECGGSIIRSEGCAHCVSCGASMCEV